MRDLLLVQNETKGAKIDSVRTLAGTVGAAPAGIGLAPAMNRQMGWPMPAALVATAADVVTTSRRTVEMAAK
jgi:hypothetical protein